VGYTSSTVASCVITLSTDTITVSSDKYPCVASAPLVSQQQLGTTGESHSQFTQSLATATGHTVSQCLIPSVCCEISGLINVTAGQSHPTTSAAGTPPNSVARNHPVIPPVCVPNVTSSPVTTVGSLPLSLVPTQPVIVVNTPQIVRAYNGSTSWTSFRDQFKRVATVNRWEDDTTRAQHLMLALEGTAAEVLKEINDTSPTVYQDIWKALSRRFGEVDEVRESMRKFENRKQLESETVVEYEQALRNLYRLAWPKATPEQKDMAFKTRFEEGLNNSDMQQYLRLHAMSDTFENTEQKARRCAASIEAPKTKRSVRITTPPFHESVQIISDDNFLIQRMDRIENMVRSLQVKANNIDTTSSDTELKYVTSREPRKQSQASRAK